MGSFPLTLSTGFESNLCCASQANLVQGLPAPSVLKPMQINPPFSALYTSLRDLTPPNQICLTTWNPHLVCNSDWHISKLAIFFGPQHCSICHLFTRDRGLRSPLQTTQITQHTHTKVPAMSKKWYPEMHIEIRNPPVCHKLLDFNYGAGGGLALLNLFVTEVNICHRII